MKETFETLHQTSLLDLPNAISSPGSESGAMRSGLPGGPTTDRCGRDPAHASLSPRQAREKGLLTSGTSGLTGSGSFASARLSTSLANRLRERTDVLGSTLWRLTWKRQALPSGRSIFRLAASARPISDPDYSGWPTPAAFDGKGFVKKDLTDKTSKKGKSGGRANLREYVTLAIRGQMPFGSIASTGNEDQPNPEFFRWAMGLPRGWSKSAPTATRLSRRSRQSS